MPTYMHGITIARGCRLLLEEKIMCAQAISICIPFSSLEGTNDVCTLKRILYMLFGRVGACDESSGASEKELQVLSAYEVPTYP